jgi:hypothetical protein
MQPPAVPAEAAALSKVTETLPRLQRFEVLQSVDRESHREQAFR